MEVSPIAQMYENQRQCGCGHGGLSHHIVMPWLLGSHGSTLSDEISLADNPLACMRSSAGKGGCAQHWNQNQKGVSVLDPGHPSFTLFPLGWDQ